MVQLLDAVDLNDPVVQSTMLAMLPLPEEEAAEVAAGKKVQQADQQQQQSSEASEGALWPVGQVGDQRCNFAYVYECAFVLCWQLHPA